ncbi:hypothetical protein [Corynebacterium sp. TAE3-ERU2]|uniref:hypothetical protein n=1 Tax=Corynebacterium sp. TAE3-ERU2 TaxID=2849497 RepID=UPI001C448006|nr:hypothetical protein [Corynebacterium sp. TAE3-ERU2]MBV7302931.1 hypothetical protein [Corynebacterium sp. TAE3-ERU2]
MSHLDFVFPITRIRRCATERDALGNPHVEEERDIVLAAGWYMPQSSEGPEGGHPLVDVDLNVFLPPQTVTETDALEVEGTVYEVVGVANYDHNPFGWSPGADVVYAKRRSSHAPAESNPRSG